MNWEEEAGSLVTGGALGPVGQDLPWESAPPGPGPGAATLLLGDVAPRGSTWVHLRQASWSSARCQASVQLPLQRVGATLRAGLVVLGQGPGKCWKLHPAWEPVGALEHGRVIPRVLWIPGVSDVYLLLGT